MSGPRHAWERVGSRVLWRSQWYDVRQDAVRIHTGEVITYTYQDHPGAVMVVPVTPDGRVLLLHQYRYLFDSWQWEFPAGGVQPGERFIDAAQRELAEETGHAAARLASLGQFAPSKSVSNERLELYLALDVYPLATQPVGDHTELIRVETRSMDDVVDMALRGEMHDGQSALAALLAYHRLRRGDMVDVP